MLLGHLSHLMTKPAKWTLHPAKNQINLGICPFWSAFAVHMKKYWILSYPLSALQRLWSDGADAQADLSLRWVHRPFCWFCHEAAQISTRGCKNCFGCTDLKSKGPQIHIGEKKKTVVFVILLPIGAWAGNEPWHNKTNKMSVRPAKTRISLGIHSVWSVFTKKAWVFSYPLSAQRRLWLDWADAQADLSLRWAHMPFWWFCHVVAQMVGW